MTTPILIILPMYNVMEMKQSLQTVIMSYCHLHIALIIMELLLYSAKRVSLHEHLS